MCRRSTSVGWCPWVTPVWGWFPRAFCRISQLPMINLSINVFSAWSEAADAVVSARSLPTMLQWGSIRGIVRFQFVSSGDVGYVSNECFLFSKASLLILFCCCALHKYKVSWMLHGKHITIALLRHVGITCLFLQSSRPFILFSLSSAWFTSSSILGWFENNDSDRFCAT